MNYNKEQILAILATIADPEIPVISISEIGMLKDVIISENGYEVILTPTYTGCPAMGIIAEDIITKLKENNISPVTVKTVFDTAWTTDNISKEAKEKMRRYGIAPPLTRSCNNEIFTINVIPCPQCGSFNTVLVSRFGSTACKAMYKCSDCMEPFEYFKCH